MLVKIEHLVRWALYFLYVLIVPVPMLLSGTVTENTTSVGRVKAVRYYLSPFTHIFLIVTFLDPFACRLLIVAYRQSLKGLKL